MVHFLTWTLVPVITLPQSQSNLFCLEPVLLPALFQSLPSLGEWLRKLYPGAVIILCSSKVVSCVIWHKVLTLLFVPRPVYSYNLGVFVRLDFHHMKI